MTLHDRSMKVFVTEIFINTIGDIFRPRKCCYKFRNTNQPKSCFVFYDINGMGKVSNRIVKICIDNNSFTYSLIQN